MASASRHHSDPHRSRFISETTSHPSPSQHSLSHLHATCRNDTAQRGTARHPVPRRGSHQGVLVSSKRHQSSHKTALGTAARLADSVTAPRSSSPPRNPCARNTTRWKPPRAGTARARGVCTACHTGASAECPLSTARPRSPTSSAYTARACSRSTPTGRPRSHAPPRHTRPPRPTHRRTPLEGRTPSRLPRSVLGCPSRRAVDGVASLSRFPRPPHHPRPRPCQRAARCPRLH